MPLTVVLLAAVLTMDYVVIDSYNWWYGLLLPGCVALISGSILGKERRQKNRNILSLPVDMRTVWDGKVCYGIQMLAISLFLLFTAVLFVWLLDTYMLHISFPVAITLWRQFTAAMVLFLTSLWQVPFCFLLQQFFGGAAAPLIHVAGCGIMGFSISLKPCFLFFPGAIPARLMCGVLGILPNGLPAKPGNMTYSPELTDMTMFPVSLISSVIWFFLLWGIGRQVFGKRVME